MMFETYRMLGREHEADLEREARRRALGRNAAKGAPKWPPLAIAVVAVVVAGIAFGATSAQADTSSAPVAIPFEKRWVGPGPYVGTPGDGGDLGRPVGGRR